MKETTRFSNIIQNFDQGLCFLSLENKDLESEDLENEDLESEDLENAKEAPGAKCQHVAF